MMNCNMNFVSGYFKYIVIPFLSGVFLISCTRESVVSTDQIERLDAYINSDNIFISEMFADDQMIDYGVQPALTQKELNMLDALADRVPSEVRKQFDQKYTAWLNCWTPLDSIPVHADATRQLLKCSGAEFQELIEFCKQQNDEVFLLLCQLAARASCPYDQFLLHPVYELLEKFPEFNKFWTEVNLSLQQEKPDFKNRTCNEPTIWYTRKILEAKYRYTYASGITTMFSTRKMLLMTQ